MKHVKLTLLAACLGLASAASAIAADPGSEAARQERMDQALESYRSTQPAESRDAQRGHYHPEDARNPNPGPAARAEDSLKRGAHRAGMAVEHGARKVGHAVGKGVRKTGEAIHRGGEKLEETTTPKP